MIRGSGAFRLALISTSILWAPVALAQNAGDQSPHTAPATAGAQPEIAGEIIVTAQKRSQRLSDVPMSITALSGTQLQAKGITQPADLDRVVPGFSFRPSNFGTPVYTIRGVGFFENSVAVAPTVSVYVDQVPLPYSVMTEGAALDLERVEVLKGPQGTLFGENSTGGAINYIANKPGTVPAAGITLGYGNFNSFHGDGFISGPILDTLDARLAISTDQNGDWQKSETRNATNGAKNFTTGRLLLDWKPSDKLKFELNGNGWIDRSDTQAAQFVEFSAIKPTGYQDVVPALEAYKPAPNDARIADWDEGSSLQRHDNFYQLSLRADWSIADNATLTSITADSGLHQIAPTDSDGTPIDNFFRTLHTQIHSFSQELRLSGQFRDNRVKWMIGVNYQYDRTNDGQFTTTDATNNGIGSERYYDYLIYNDQSINTFSAFGSIDYQITSTLTAQGSIRYTKSDNHFHGCLQDSGDGELATVFSQLSTTPIGPGQCVTLSATHEPAGIVYKSLDEDNVSWRTGLSWKPRSTTLLYANVTQGYKAGSFPTLAAITSDQFNPIKQESLLAYEVGFKQDFRAYRLQLTGAAFYYDYRDKQLIGYNTTAFGNLPGFISIPKSRVAGGELNAIWTPIHPLTVTLGATYVSSRVESNLNTNSPFGVSSPIDGEAFPDTPNWQLTGDVQYNFAISDSLEAFVGAGGEYRTSTTAAFAGGPYFVMPGYGLLDLRAGLHSKTARWSATVWGRNVTNQFYIQNISHVVDTVARTTGMPATFGFTLGYRY